MSSVSRNINKPKTCSMCKIEKPADEFSIVADSKKLKYRNARCRPCHAVLKSEYRKKTQPRITKQAVEKVKNRKQKLIEMAGGFCKICTKSYCLAAMEFHHIGEKDFTISKMMQNKFEKIVKEVDKCILVCSNCHRFIHTEASHLEDIKMIQELYKEMCGAWSTGTKLEHRAEIR